MPRYYVAGIPFDSNDALQHYGVKGMKWNQHIFGIDANDKYIKWLKDTGQNIGKFTNNAVTTIGNAAAGASREVGKALNKASNFVTGNQARQNADNASINAIKKQIVAGNSNPASRASQNLRGAANVERQMANVLHTSANDTPFYRFVTKQNLTNEAVDKEKNAQNLQRQADDAAKLSNQVKREQKQDVRDAYNQAMDAERAYDRTLPGMVNKGAEAVGNAAEKAAGGAKGFLNSAGKWVSTAANDAKNWAGNAVNDVGNAANQAGQWIGDRAKDVSNVATDAWNGVTDAANQAGDWIGDRAKDVGNVATDAWNGVTDAANDAGQWIGDRARDVGNAATNAWNGVSGAANQAGQWIKEQTIPEQRITEQTIPEQRITEQTIPEQRITEQSYGDRVLSSGSVLSNARTASERESALRDLVSSIDSEKGFGGGSDFQNDTPMSYWAERAKNNFDEIDNLERALKYEDDPNSEHYRRLKKDLDYHRIDNDILTGEFYQNPNAAGKFGPGNINYNNKPDNVSQENWDYYCGENYGVGPMANLYGMSMQERYEYDKQHAKHSALSDKPEGVGDAFWQNYIAHGGTREDYEREWR